MSWEVSGIGTEAIGLLWPFLECFTGLLFLELFISFIVPSWPLLFSVSCSSVSCFRFWFLLFVSLIHKVKLHQFLGLRSH